MGPFRLRALATVALSSMMVAGCGGDGGGSVASAGSAPPATPPPAGANANLLGTLKSETFANTASQGSLTVSGNKETGSVGAATANFVYDATTQSYTVTTGGSTQTFAPSNINTADSSSTETLYEKTSGSTTTSLTLTKPGTSGRFTYQYVGSAFLETINQTSSTSGSGTIYGIAYGEPTPASAVPVTGMASYAVDLVGAQGTNGSGAVTGITGKGGLTVDFATGNLVINGNLDSTIPYGTGLEFYGTAKVSSAGTFSGQFGLEGPAANGTVNGGFYGPSAQEVGAAFTSADPYNSAFDAAGVLLGRQTTTTDGSVPELFTELRLRQTATAATYGTAELASSGGELAFMPDYTALQTTFGLTAISDVLAIAPGTTGLSYLLPTGLYVNTALAYNDTGATPVYDFLLIGPITQYQSLPTSGTAQYNVTLAGIAQKTGSAAYGVDGSGLVQLALATGAVSTSGTLNLASPASWSGTGTLSSTTNQFGGTFGATGGVSATGTWQGAFYGTYADSVGALFTMAGTDGTKFAGVIAGSEIGNTTDPIPPAPTLNTLTSQITLPAYESIYQRVAGVSPDASATNSEIGFTGALPLTVFYQPTIQSYQFTSGTNLANLPLINNAFSPGTYDSADSTASFAAYSGNNAGTLVTAKIFLPVSTNPVIALTYTSFAEVTQPTTPYNATMATPSYHYYVFGLPTLASAMPTTGTGSYSGVVYGSGGTVTANGTPGVDFSITGTGPLTANFATGSVDTTLNLTRAAAASTPASSLGAYAFAAQLSGVTFSGTSGGNSINGSFFGPAANEVGAAWSTSTMAGAFVGKKN